MLFRSINDISISPGGDQVAYVISTPSWRHLPSMSRAWHFRRTEKKSPSRRLWRRVELDIHWRGSHVFLLRADCRSARRCAGTSGGSRTG